MISGLQEVDSALSNPIHQPMLLGDSASPATREFKLERLRLSDANKGVPQNSLH